VIGFFQLGTKGVGAAHLAPGFQHLLERVFFEFGQRQRLVVVAPRHFFFNEAQGNACLFEQGEQIGRVGRVGNQRVEKVQQLQLGGSRVGQRQAIEHRGPGLQVGDNKRGRRGGGVHFFLSIKQARWRLLSLIVRR